MKRHFALWLLLLASSPSAFPQSGEDSTFLHATIGHTVTLYREAIGVQARLYNGSRYLAPEHSIDDHPFFSSVDWLTGDVFYDGEFFQEVPLMFDLHSEQLIAEHASTGHAIQLVREKLQHFTIDGHRFEKMGDEASGLPQQGFYDILYDGETRVVVKRQKILLEEIIGSTVQVTFSERNRYFLLKDGVYSSVRNKASVLKVLGDRKQELRKFLKQQRIYFTENRERLLKSVAEHYDQIK